MNRFFFALSPDKKTREQILSYRQRLDISGQLTQGVNIHLTVLFLGHLNTNQQQDVIRQAHKVCFEPFELVLDTLGSFKRNILWMGMQNIPAPLLSLHQQLQFNIRQSEKNNITLEHRDFRPHVTLARRAGVKPPVLEALPSPNIRWAVHEFVLYESIDTLDGVRYQKVKAFA